MSDGDAAGMGSADVGAAAALAAGAELLAGDELVLDEELQAAITSDAVRPAVANSVTLPYQLRPFAETLMFDRADSTDRSTNLGRARLRNHATPPVDVKGPSVAAQRPAIDTGGASPSRPHERTVGRRDPTRAKLIGRLTRCFDRARLVGNGNGVWDG